MMAQTRAHGLARAAAALAVALAMAAQAPAQTVSTFLDEAGISWDERPEALVVSYRDVWAELANQDPTPLVRVFGDGRVLIHHPDYTPRAGQYELRLGRDDLAGLLASLVDKGLATAEPAALGRAKAAVERRRWEEALAADRSPELFMVADDSTSVFEIHLTGYRPPGSAMTTGEVHRTLSWLGLGTDAERYPEIEPIRRLRGAELELRSLIERDDLERVR